MDDPLTLTIQIIQALTVLILGVGLIMLARAVQRIRSSLDRLDEALGRIGQDARPALDRARAVGENLNFIAMSVRKEVERASATISVANDRLAEALDAADERVQELGALIDVVHGEVEDTLLTASSALRGIRTGAKMLRRSKRNTDEENQVDESEE